MVAASCGPNWAKVIKELQLFLFGQLFKDYMVLGAAV